MIAGVRGSGKTVSLSVIADHYAERNDWFVLRLSADSDLIAGAISELNRVVGLSVQKIDQQLENDAILRNLLEKFDGALASYAYEKIWSELSDLDHKIVYVIASGYEKTIEIRTQLSISPQLLNTYRKRLMERGIVDGSVHGVLTLALPRFDAYIDTYCDVTL